MNTINEEDKTNETPLEDLRQQALKHYEDVSTTSNHWSGFIVKAIKAYDPKRDAEVERLRKENEELRADDLSSSEWLRTLNELAALKKQVEDWDRDKATWIQLVEEKGGQINNLKKQVEEMKELLRRCQIFIEDQAWTPHLDKLHNDLETYITDKQI